MDELMIADVYRLHVEINTLSGLFLFRYYRCPHNEAYKVVHQYAHANLNEILDHKTMANTQCLSRMFFL